MDYKLLFLMAGLFIFTLFTISLADATDAIESYQISNEDHTTNISTILPPKEASHPVPTENATIQSSVMATEAPKRKMKHDRSRRQGYLYVSSAAKYGINTIFDMCPPLATTCPTCTDESVQVPPGFCNLVVLKVVALSPPQIDGNGRVCGKFGILKLYGDFDEKAFRRLLRFSVQQSCGCAVKASGAYFLISPLSAFLKDGLLFNQIVLTEQAILISADRYIENEILEVLNRCPEVGYDPGVSDPRPLFPIPPVPVMYPSPTSYVPPPPKPSIPFVPPDTKLPIVYPVPSTLSPTHTPPPVIQPGPYNPPPVVQPGPYDPPPIVQPGPYDPPPVVQPGPYDPPPVVQPGPYDPPPVVQPGPYNPPPVVQPGPYNPPPVVQPGIYNPPPVVQPGPYNPPPVVQPGPYNPLPVVQPGPYNPPPVVQPGPYNPPPVVQPGPYNPPPVVQPGPYDPPPVVQPHPSNPPPQILPIPSPVPSSQLLPYRSKIPFLYPSMTKCLIPDTCPVCGKLDSVGDITGQYCAAGFAYLAVVRVPDASSLQGADSSYLGPTCMNLRTNIVYDITRTRDPNIMVTALTALLPTKCSSCFEGLSGPIIVLIMGQVPPVPPIVQLDANFQVYMLPVPSTIVLPSCDIYSMYSTLAVPYSILPIAPQPYATNDCSTLPNQTCPSCQNYPDTSFSYACANGFAIVTELNLAGPYFTSQRLPAISVKTTTTYYSKSVEVIITKPPEIDCIKGFFKIIQNIGLAPLNFPGEIIPFVSLPSCECLSQGFKRLLIFSSGPLIVSPEGVLHLSKDINIAFLQPEAALPSCGAPPPPPYVTSQPVVIPQHQPLSPYPRDVRVPLTYVPPSPPPASYSPPSESPPAYLLPPDYIPHPVKQSSDLPPSLHITPQLAIPPPISVHLPESHPPSYSTELQFEETPPPIVGCVKFDNGLCVEVDPDQNEEMENSLNVNENIPFRHPFTDLNSFVYEDSSVWSPAFNECLDSAPPSCPHSLKGSLEKFEEFFCKAETALLVAVGIDFGNIGNETAVSKKLIFIKPELPYVGIDYDVPENPSILKVTVTPNKTMERKIQLQNNADYCYTESVFVLSDLSYALKPRVVVGRLDISSPGFCDSEIFDKVPSYGILLSTLQPSNVTNPVQLTDAFTFIPLPEGNLILPNCDKSVEEKYPASQVSGTKFWVPITPEESVICKLSEKDSCGASQEVREEIAVPCDVKSAAIVIVKDTSAGNSVGPNLEILETTHEYGEKVVTLNVKLNIDDAYVYEDAYSTLQNPPDRCQYAVVRILKDLSRHPLINQDDVLTIIANTNCDSPIFKLTNEVFLLLSDDLISPNTVIPLKQNRTAALRISPGTTRITFCEANPHDDAVDEKILNEVNPESVAFIDHVILDDVDNDTSPVYDVREEYPDPSDVESNEILEVDCLGHVDNTCPVCEDIDSISSDVYCNSGLSLFAEVIEQDIEGTCGNGIILSLFEITSGSMVPESKMLKIPYTIPSYCSCPALEKGTNIVLLLEESTPVAGEMSITLSKGNYLYSTPLETTFPSCYSEDSLQARSKNIDNVIVLDSPYKELRKIMPELSKNMCPTMGHTCPQCRNMDDKELENLYCSSEEVLLVSKNKNQKENPRKFTRFGKATFTQHRVASNYSLEMNIEKYKKPCALPVEAGNCHEYLDRFYFDTDFETCSSFTYTGCGGNANNFVSEEECENTCFVEDICEEGILDIKKVIKSSDDANYEDNKFHYTLPEHCDCSEILKGGKQGYLMSSKVEDFSFSSIQLSQNYHLVPLSKNQLKKKFSCAPDGDFANSTPAPKNKKNKFSLFG